MIPAYHESLLSQLYPGQQHSSNCLIPAVLTFEERLCLPSEHRAKVVWRLDRGFGGDENINWLLERGYQVLAKGCSHRRTAKLVGLVQRWRQVRPDRFIGCAPTLGRFSLPVETFVVRYQTKTGWKHAYLLSTLHLGGPHTLQLYDQRGAAETEFRTDKSGGLFLDKRRKHKRDAQEAWVILTDMAHNYLAFFTRTYLADSPFATYGPLRIGRDLMRIPGFVHMEGDRLLSVKLLKSSPLASALLPCLERFWE
jgi:hypothetical protein